MREKIHKRKTVRVGVLLGVLGTMFVVGLVVTVTHYRSTEVVVQSVAQRVEQQRAIVGTREVWERRLKELKASEPAQRYLLSESRPSLAEAELQQRVQQAVNEGGGELVTMSGLPERPELELGHVAVQVRMQGTIRELIRILYALEYGEPFLRVDDVQIRVSDSAGTDLREADQAVTLNVVFGVVGFLVEQGATQG